MGCRELEVSRGTGWYELMGREGIWGAVGGLGGIELEDFGGLESEAGRGSRLLRGLEEGTPTVWSF